MRQRTARRVSRPSAAPGRALAGAVAGAVAIGIGGCHVDFTDPVVASARPTTLHVSVEFRADEPRPLQVGGAFRPGVDESGRRGIVTDGTIRLGAALILPTDTLDNGIRTYSEGWDDLAAFDLAAIRLVAPAGASLDHRPPPITFPVRQRVGLDTIVASPGDTVALPTDPGQPPSIAPRGTEWSLALTTSGTQFHLAGLGSPPATFVVPTEWLGWGGGDPVTVRLTVVDHWTTENSTADYHVTLSVRSVLRWAVVPDPGDTDG